MTRAASPASMMFCVLGGATVAQQVFENTLERKLPDPAVA